MNNIRVLPRLSQAERKSLSHDNTFILTMAIYSCLVLLQLSRVVGDSIPETCAMFVLIIMVGFGPTVYYMIFTSGDECRHREINVDSLWIYKLYWYCLPWRRIAYYIILLVCSLFVFVSGIVCYIDCKQKKAET